MLRCLVLEYATERAGEVMAFGDVESIAAAKLRAIVAAARTLR